MLDCCPCLTRSNTSNRRLYLTNRKLRLDVEHFEKLQDVPHGYYNYATVMSSAEYAGALGNGLQVTMAKHVLASLLYSAGFISKPVF